MINNIPGPGSDPNPAGNLTHMRQISYMVDMERGGGSSPLTGKMLVGEVDIVRGSGILNVNFDGVLINAFGIHIYGDSITKALFFRRPDGTLAATMNRITTTVDSKGTIPAGTVILVTTDHEFFFDSAGHEIRVGGDFFPSTDSSRDLGEDTTPRRWKTLHVDTVKFSDGTSMITAP